MDSLRPTIDICPDYGGCFNFGDGGASSFPDEVYEHPRKSEILEIERSLERWAAWFDTMNPTEPNDAFPWDEFFDRGELLARRLQEVLGDDYVILFRHHALDAR